MERAHQSAERLPVAEGGAPGPSSGDVSPFAWLCSFRHHSPPDDGLAVAGGRFSRGARGCDSKDVKRGKRTRPSLRCLVFAATGCRGE